MRERKTGEDRKREIGEVRETGEKRDRERDRGRDVK